MPISRRHFVLTGAAAGAAAAGGIALNAASGSPADPEAGAAAATPTSVPTATPAPMPSPTGAGDRVLVVVQMGGGNDGLNTLVPVADGRYSDARPTIGLAEAALPIAGRDDYGLHPSLEALVPLWAGGQLAALQAIGLPEQSRSHFVALDTWWAGGAEQASSGGWLGRWMDATPDAAHPMRAISLGGGSPALLGGATNPIVVQSLDGFDLRGPRPQSVAADAFEAMAEPAGPGLLGRAQAAIPATIDAVETLGAALGSVDDAEPRTGRGEYGADGAVTLFEAAADIVSADLGAQVIVVNIGGFDSHANQLAQQAPLLAGVGTGIATLFDRLTASGRAADTLVMAYSEFGRRVAENGSGGTDHGSGGLAFLAGPAVAESTIVGDLDLANLDNGDVPRDIDSRSLYANALTWLGGPVDEVLGGPWDTYDLLVA